MPGDVGAERYEDAAVLIDASVPVVAAHPDHPERTSPEHPGHLSCSEKAGVNVSETAAGAGPSLTPLFGLPYSLGVMDGYTVGRFPPSPRRS